MTARPDLWFNALCASVAGHRAAGFDPFTVAVPRDPVRLSVARLDADRAIAAFDERWPEVAKDAGDKLTRCRCDNVGACEWCLEQPLLAVEDTNHADYAKQSDATLRYDLETGAIHVESPAPFDCEALRPWADAGWGFTEGLGYLAAYPSERAMLIKGGGGGHRAPTPEALAAKLAEVAPLGEELSCGCHGESPCPGAGELSHEELEKLRDETQAEIDKYRLAP